MTNKDLMLLSNPANAKAHFLWLESEVPVVFVESNDMEINFWQQQALLNDLFYDLQTQLSNQMQNCFLTEELRKEYKIACSSTYIAVDYTSGIDEGAIVTVHNGRITDCFDVTKILDDGLHIMLHARQHGKSRLNQLLQHRHDSILMDLVPPVYDFSTTKPIRHKRLIIPQNPRAKCNCGSGRIARKCCG